MPKNVLVISNGLIHPPMIGRFWLRSILTGMQGYKFTHVRSMEKLLSLDLNPFHGLVLYFHHRRISEPGLEAFDAFVTGGGGVLAIHSATASFKESDRFTDILGGKFSGHGPVETFDVLPVSSKSKIFGKIPAFRFTDELYLHDLQPDIEVHFTTIHDGQSVPVVWTRSHGDGRVCFASPGHKAASMQVPEYQSVLTRGLSWVCDYKSRHD